MSKHDNELIITNHLNNVEDDDLGIALAAAYVVLEDIRTLMAANYKTMEAAILTPHQLADYRERMILPSLRRLQSIDEKNQQQPHSTTTRISIRRYSDE